MYVRWFYLISGVTYLLVILNVRKVVLSEGKLVLVGEFICRLLWCLKFRKMFSSVPSKEKKPYIRKKLPVTKLHIAKTSRMFLGSQSFQRYDNRIKTIKNEWYFVWKSAPNQAYCRGLSEKDTFDSDYYAKYGKIFRHLTFTLHKNLLKFFDCSKKSKKLSIMKTELNISTASPKNVTIM